jgi:fructose/tagatose bisphosphate aldolase
MNDRRRALISLLDQYPLERDLYLHDGRRDVSPRDEFAGKIECLFDPSLFQRVMQASKDYVERFPGGHLTFHGAARKMQEEYFEFQHAVGDYAAAKTDDTLPSEHFNSYQELRKEAAREMIDLLVTVGGLGATIGLTWEDIESAAHDTLDKLDSRTTENYAWYESIKQVAKKSKMGDAS